MTKYPAVKRNLQSTSWKKRENQRKWRSALGVMVTAMLLFAAVNGILKTLSLGRFFTDSSWDSKSAFAAVLNTDPVSVFIYSPTTEKASLVKFDDGLNVFSSDSEDAVFKLKDRAALGENGKDLANFVSRISRSPIKHYVIFEKNSNVSAENLANLLDGFSSVWTPVKIFVFGPDEVKDINITRSDLIRLWWQIKSLGANDLNFIDARSFSSERRTSDGSKVLGVDDVSLNMFISDYLENDEVLSESKDVEIVNASGDSGAGQMAADFSAAVGVKVTDVSYSEELVNKTVIVTSEDSYTASYLARIFDCDIKSVSDSEKGKIKVILGQDFAENF